MFQPAMLWELQDMLDIACLLHGGEKAIADNTYNKSNQDMQHTSMNRTLRLHNCVSYMTSLLLSSSSFGMKWITGNQGPSNFANP